MKLNIYGEIVTEKTVLMRKITLAQGMLSYNDEVGADSDGNLALQPIGVELYNSTVITPMFKQVYDIVYTDTITTREAKLYKTIESDIFDVSVNEITVDDKTYQINEVIYNSDNDSYDVHTGLIIDTIKINLSELHQEQFDRYEDDKLKMQMLLRNKNEEIHEIVQMCLTEQIKTKWYQFSLKKFWKNYAKDIKVNGDLYRLYFRDGNPVLRLIERKQD